MNILTEESFVSIKKDPAEARSSYYELRYDLFVTNKHLKSIISTNMTDTIKMIEKKYTTILSK